jgi:hypothetical protein
VLEDSDLKTHATAAFLSSLTQEMLSGVGLLGRLGARRFTVFSLMGLLAYVKQAYSSVLDDSETKAHAAGRFITYF